MIPDNVLIYLVVGFILTALLDFHIKEYSSIIPFTFLEVIWSILLWPILVVVLLKGFFDKNY